MLLHKLLIKQLSTTIPKIVFLFSGQGSHYRGMGKTLYDSYPCFAKSLKQSDALVEQHLGQSIIGELYNRKHKNFDDLLITHPAIVAVELAMLEVMKELGITPDYISGNSLGEFAAGVAAGIWTKEMALEAAIEQAKSIVQGGVEGGMLAVINESASNLAHLLAQNELYIASDNFPDHFTVSGEKDRLDVFENQLNKLEVSFLRLPVAFPFHSPLIEAGKTGFNYYTYTAPPHAKPSKGFISGLYSKELDAIPPDYFWKVISQRTNFITFVEYMEAKGPCLYLDLGPSGTAATFVKYNLSRQSNSITHPIMTPYNSEPKQLQSLRNILKTSM
jgi:bacillaene synthase trans-acting acyltransferase